MPAINGSGGHDAPEGGHPLENGARVELAMRASASDPVAAIRVQQWAHRDALREFGEMMQSLGVSISEASYRGSDVIVRHHVYEARLTVMAAIQSVKALAELNKAADAQKRKPRPYRADGDGNADKTERR
jgi:hypothetical protein